MKLKIEYLNKEELKPYANNAKIHTAEQVEQIKSSIREFGFNDPIAIWHDNEVVEGHGRLLAVMEMDDITDVPIIRLDGLTDEQRRAYMLAHNNLTMNTGFDLDVLNSELDEILGYNMSDYGFDVIDDLINDQEDETASKYTAKVQVPQYEPTGEIVDVDELYTTSKTQYLIEHIQMSTVDKEVKQFLIEAAHRHSVFNYKKIAEFYARADKETQELMEQSALVIIDFDDAIANGYASLEQGILEQIAEDDSDE